MFQGVLDRTSLGHLCFCTVWAQRGPFGMHNCDLWVALGPLWGAHWAHLGPFLDPKWSKIKCPKVSLTGPVWDTYVFAQFGPHEGHLGYTIATFGSQWNRFGKLTGPIWGHVWTQSGRKLSVPRCPWPGQFGTLMFSHNLGATSAIWDAQLRPLGPTAAALGSSLCPFGAMFGPKVFQN